MTGPRPTDEQIEVTERNGVTALVLGGVVQSVAVDAGGAEPDGYWRWLLPETAPLRVLLLGFGAGTVARLLQRRFPDATPEIIGVDDDVAVLDRADGRFGEPVRGLRPVHADARAYLAASVAAGERFDLIVVDLFRDGEIPAFVCDETFLRRLRGALAADGLLTVNLNRGRQHRAQLRALSRLFALQRAIGTGMNLVVHARPRRRRRNAKTT